MGRQRKKTTQALSAKEPWYKSLWAKISAFVAALGMVVINLPAFLDGIEKSPGAIGRVSNKFWSWHYEDAKWSGLWSGDTEGYVDSGDIDVSPVDLKVHLTVDKGRVGGEISAQSICKGIPFLDYLLLEGEISWGKADITAFDFVGGKRQDFFRFTARRDGMILIITAANPNLGWIPKESRIVLHPNLTDEAIYSSLHGSCSKERAAFMDKIHKEQPSQLLKPAPANSEN